MNQDKADKKSPNKDKNNFKSKRNSTVNKGGFWKKLLVFAAICLAATVIAVLVMNRIVIAAGEKNISTAESISDKQADAVMVFGARVTNGILSDTLKNRVDKAIELYKAGVVGKILMTGDHGRENYDEVNAMKQYAVDKGVPADDVFCDHAGFNSYESLYRARDVFMCKSVILVTQEFHIYRTLYLAERLGLEAYGVIAPDAANANGLYNEMRETLARVKAVFNGMLLPEPTYLGEAIPISGSGSATDDRKY